MEKKNKRKRKIRKARLKLTRRDGIILILLISISLFILFSPLVSAVYDLYTTLRFESGHTEAGYIDTDFCGMDLNGFTKTYESGCGSYTGWTCSNSIILQSFNLTLMYSQAPPYNNSLNFSSPIWAYANVSCIYYATNSTYPYQEHLIYAWKVKSSSGQFCTIQNRWDYYVFDRNTTFMSMSLDKFPIDNSSYFEGNTYCEVYIPPYINPTYPDLFMLDFTQKISLILLVIFFIIILILIFYKYIMYASILIIIWGFIFLFSGVNILISFLVIAIGCIFAVIFGGKR